jgi:branched-chain amino acid transport system permease protein
MLALGYNVIITNCGLFHLGYVMYVGIGAYTGALLTLTANLSFWLVLPITVMVVIAISYILGFVMLRFRGDYLCLITLAFAEITKVVAFNWVRVTRGPLGLAGITAPSIFGYSFFTMTPFYYLILILAALSYLIVYSFVRSSYGLEWSTIKEDEEAAQSLGINVFWSKQLSLAVGAALGSAGGCFSAHLQMFLHPSSLTYYETFLILMVVILGGGGIIGTLLGAGALIIMTELFRGLLTVRIFLIGLFFIVIMILRPEGFSRGQIRHFRILDKGTV